MHASRLSTVRVAAVVAGFLAATASQVHAWGDVAHRIICAIAMREMSEPARREVNRLIAMDDDFSTFPEACVWADHLRDAARRRGAAGIREHEHYINTARSTVRIQSEECPLASECLFSAIQSDTKILSAHQASDAERLAALKFLGHWIGDIHQPFHVSFGDDRGGNSIDVKGECSSNLHAVWDQCLVRKRFRVGDTGKIAQKLAATISDKQRMQWKAVPLAGWADESYQIVISSDVKYCIQRGGICRYSARDAEFTAHMPHKTVSIGSEYVATYGELVEIRLQQAGVRLAKVLDALFGSH